MCGIFGYLGTKNASSMVFEGLKRLEYRGYDSWGIAVAHHGGIDTTKQVGAIGNASVLTNLPEASVAIGHTRWATHGSVTKTNAHPHYASDNSFVLAQNGIVENHEKLKQELQAKGHQFLTQTDTEVIVRLVEEKRKSIADLKQAVITAFKELDGRNTIIVLTKDGTVIAARNGSPLVIGLSDHEIFLSSDTLSFSPYARNMIVVDNGQLVVCKDGEINLFTIADNMPVKKHIEPVSFTADKVDKEGFAHFMIKEIFDTPKVLLQLTRQDKRLYEELGLAIKQAKTVYTIASGTAGVSAAQIAYYLRHIAKINAISLIGADAKEYYELFAPGDLLIAPSQSGETADVLEVLEYAKAKGLKIASYVNMPGSMMTKLSDYKFMMQAGPEICVMATKTFTSQVAWGYLIAKAAAGAYEDAIMHLKTLSEAVDGYLKDQNNHRQIKQVGENLTAAKDIFLLGKSQNFQIIKEGMVKLIEATYKHAHAMPAGDLKHYAITLMETGVPVIVAVSDDDVKTDVLNAVAQVKARGATTIGITSEHDEAFDLTIEVPKMEETAAIMNIIPLQLLAYYMTIALGNNVDKPRNIAKSVTVK